MRRVLLALLVEAGCFAGCVLWLGLTVGTGDAGQAALGIFIAVVGTGLPVLAYCCRHRLWEPWRVLLLGGLAGALCATPFLGGSIHPGFLIFLFVLAGTAFGAVFWLIAIWRNDDLTCPTHFCLPCGTVYRVARNALRHQSK